MSPADAGERPALVRRVRMVNPKGLHARPCHALANTALRFAAEISVSCGRRRADGKSILDLIGLAAVPGAELTLEARGPDAADALDALEALVRTGFGEPV